MTKEARESAPPLRGNLDHMKRALSMLFEFVAAARPELGLKVEYKEDE